MKAPVITIVARVPGHTSKYCSHCQKDSRLHGPKVVCRLKNNERLFVDLEERESRFNYNQWYWKLVSYFSQPTQDYWHCRLTSYCSICDHPTVWEDYKRRFNRFRIGVFWFEDFFGIKKVYW